MFQFETFSSRFSAKKSKKLICTLDIPIVAPIPGYSAALLFSLLLRLARRSQNNQNNPVETQPRRRNFHSASSLRARERESSSVGEKRSTG